MKEIKTTSTLENESPAEMREIPPEFKELFQKHLREMYLRGMSNGGKSFVGAIYEAIKKDRAQKVPPIKTIARVEVICKHYLGILEQSDVKDRTVLQDNLTVEVPNA